MARDLGILGSGMQASGALLLVLGFIFALAFLLKRYGPRQFGAPSDRRLIRIIESVSLGEKRNLSIVKVGKEHFLIASTPGSVSLLERVLLQGVEPFEPELQETADRRNSGVIAQLRRQFQKTLARSLSIGRPSGHSAVNTVQQKSSVSPVSFEEVMNSELTSRSVSIEEGDGRYVSRLAEIRRGLQSP